MVSTETRTGPCQLLYNSVSHTTGIPDRGWGPFCLGGLGAGGQGRLLRGGDISASPWQLSPRMPRWEGGPLGVQRPRQGHEL